MRVGRAPVLPRDRYTTRFPVDVQARADAAGARERLLPQILEHELSLLIVHPDYVEAELLDITTYSVIRSRDQQLVTSAEVRRLLDGAGVELTTVTAAGLG